MKRDLALVLTALSIWGIGEGMFFFFQPLYLEQLGASPVMIGSILGGMGIAMTITLIPAGYLSDHLGRRPLLWVSWVIGVVAALIMALANNLAQFVLGMLLYGMTYFVMAPLNSYVTTARGQLSVSRAITLISATYSLGAILGPLIGGFIGQRLGLRQVYFFSAAFFSISAIFIFFIKSQPIEVHDPSNLDHRFRISRSYLVYLMVIFVTVFGAYLPQPLSPNFLQNERNLNVSQIGQLGSIAAIGIVIFSLILGHLHPRRGFLLSQLTISIFALFIWRGNNFAAYAIAYLMVGGYRVIKSLAIAQTKMLVSQSKMGLGYSITETVSSSAIILSPILAGFLFEINPILMYPASIGFIIISLVLSIRFLPGEVQSSKEQVSASGYTD